jgi:hypothetical protein
MAQTFFHPAIGSNIISLSVFKAKKFGNFIIWQVFNGISFAEIGEKGSLDPNQQYWLL